MPESRDWQSWQRLRDFDRLLSSAMLGDCPLHLNYRREVHLRRTLHCPRPCTSARRVPCVFVALRPHRRYVSTAFLGSVVPAARDF